MSSTSVLVPAGRTDATWPMGRWPAADTGRWPHSEQAPYLNPIEPLSDRLARLAGQPTLSPDEQAELDRAIAGICARIRAARAEWDQRHDSELNITRELRQRAVELLQAGFAVATVAATLRLEPNLVSALEAELQEQQAAQKSYRRCPNCGGLVELPCRVCQQRVVLARREQIETT